MRRPFLLLGVLSLLTFSGAAPAYATTSTGSFDWDAGGGVLCSVVPGACPDMAMASNGDTVTVSASGSLNAATGTASGGGHSQRGPALLHGSLLRV